MYRVFVTLARLLSSGMLYGVYTTIVLLTCCSTMTFVPFFKMCFVYFFGTDLPDLRAAEIGGTTHRLTYEDLVRQHIVSCAFD